jgi:hypothetical protein
MELTAKQELDGVDWVLVAGELLRYVRSRAQVRPLPASYSAEDIVNEAVARLYGKRRAWDSKAKPNIIPHLKLIVKSLLSDKGLYGLGAVKVLGGGEPYGEEEDDAAQEVDTHRWEEEWELLLPELAGDREAMDVVEAIRGFGLAKSGEIAELLEYHVKRVYEARRRIKAALDRLEARVSGGKGL